MDSEDIAYLNTPWRIKIDTENTNLYAAQLDPVQHEHVLVFSNTTIFNDIIYQHLIQNKAKIAIFWYQKCIFGNQQYIEYQNAHLLPFGSKVHPCLL